MDQLAGGEAQQDGCWWRKPAPAADLLRSIKKMKSRRRETASSREGLTDP